jgi:curli production assembly/transport component CsgG/holdfast attachment protein HfaB
MQTDPLGTDVTTGLTGAYVPAYDTLKTNNAATRDDSSRWDDRRDPAVDSQRTRY